MTRMILVFIAVVAAFASTEAITKKSDESSGMQGNNQPVYAPPGGQGPYSQYNQGGQAAQEHGPQGQSAPGNGPQSNMYYYYYPVQDNKPKEQQYQHAAPSQANHPGSSGAQDSGPMEAAASGSEISYSSQDMNQDYNQQGQSFDPQTLSNIASQLQYSFNQQPNNYDNNAQGMQGYGGHQGDASSHIATQVHPGFNQGMGGHQGPISFPPQGAQFGGQNPFGGFAPQGQALQTQSSEVSGIASSFKKYGLSTILMPVLALAGLSLLLPTVTSLGTTTTKTKRSVENSESALASYVDKVDNYYKLYNKAIEKEECMNRMICELGDAVSSVKGRSALLMVVENLAPQWMEKKMNVFKNGALSKDMSKCKKYAC